MEVAAGGTARLTGALALLLACVVTAGGVAVWQERGERADARADQERYGAVMAAATEEAEAFINIDYRDARASIDKVAAGATGEFRDQYAESVEEVIDLLEQNKSVMDGEVLWSGVVSLDDDSARVIAATSGTVANVSTDNEPVARNFRLLLDLALVDGRWLTSNLEFIS